jgi:hypothetical protein
MNQVEAQKKWYSCQSQTPLNEILSRPIYRKQENDDLCERDLVAKADTLFLVEVNKGEASRSVHHQGYLNAVYRVSRVLGKAARVRTNAMENQDNVDREGCPNANDATRS